MLRGELEVRGHKVTGVQFNQDNLAPPAEVNIFLEVVEPRFFLYAAKQWVVPNPEWWGLQWDQYLPRFEKVLAKTRHCQVLFTPKAKHCEFLGWMSRDLLDVTVPRERKFLHLAGKSQTKNTLAVIEAWRRMPDAPELVVVSQQTYPNLPDNVKWIRRVEEGHLNEILNRCQFHIMPSAYEGWGHSLHEALGVGAVVITTNAPPMNDIAAAIHIAHAGNKSYNAAMLWQVTPQAVMAGVKKALELTPEQAREYQQRARMEFLDESAAFQERLTVLVGQA